MHTDYSYTPIAKNVMEQIKKSSKTNKVKEQDLEVVKKLNDLEHKISDECLKLFRLTLKKEPKTEKTKETQETQKKCLSCLKNLVEEFEMNLQKIKGILLPEEWNKLRQAVETKTQC